MSPIINTAISKCIAKYEELNSLLCLTDHLFISAVILNDDEIVLGVNVPRSGVVCAEMVALGSVLLSKNYRRARYIVTITKDSEGKFIISNMCGNCRQNLLYACPQIEIVIGSIENYSLIGIKKLLPYPYDRNGKKRKN